MYEVVLSNPQSDQPAIGILAVLNAEFAAMQKQRAKVYRTYVPINEKREYIFTTTSKDLHLTLGALSRSGQEKLAMLLHLEFVAGECRELLMFEDEKRTSGMLVSLTGGITPAGGAAFHISPAH